MNATATQSIGRLDSQMPVKVSEIDRESLAAFAELNALEETISTLERRLDPVLSPNLTDQKGDGKASARESVSAIGDSFRSIGDRLSCANQRISGLLNALALA